MKKIGTAIEREWRSSSMIVSVCCLLFSLLLAVTFPLLLDAWNAKTILVLQSEDALEDVLLQFRDKDVAVVSFKMSEKSVSNDSRTAGQQSEKAISRTFVNSENASGKIPNSAVKSSDGSLVGAESRKKENEKGIMEKILPMMVLPFLVSSSIIPVMLVSIKFLALKSAAVGIIAILLMLTSMFRSRTNGGGVFNHDVNANGVAMEHYGYYGDEEYGAYTNARRKR